MSMLRLFLSTTYEMAVNGKWSLMADYFVLVGKVTAAKELVITPGIPKDKEPSNA